MAAIEYAHKLSRGYNRFYPEPKAWINSRRKKMRNKNRDHKSKQEETGTGKAGFFARVAEAAASVTNKALDVVAPERQSKAVNEYV